MTPATYQTIAQLVQAACKKESQQKWATKHKISGATVSNVISGKWEAIAEKMWHRIASAVGYTAHEWHLAETGSFRNVQAWCKMAQGQGISLGLSADAGGGKTASLRHYADTHANVVYLQCAEYWTKKLFLANLYRVLGKDPDQLTAPELADGIIAEFRQQHKPLLILDEVDKLRDPLLMFFIELYNKLDGVCGFFLVGAPYLMIAWEKNAKRDKRGFREIYSRIGRKFLRLNPVKRKDVELICTANGIADEGEINAVWNAVETNADLRRVKREVEKLRMRTAA